MILRFLGGVMLTLAVVGAALTQLSSETWVQLVGGTLILVGVVGELVCWAAHVVWTRLERKNREVRAGSGGSGVGGRRG